MIHTQVSQIVEWNKVSSTELVSGDIIWMRHQEWTVLRVLPYTTLGIVLVDLKSSTGREAIQFDINTVFSKKQSPVSPSQDHHRLRTDALAISACGEHDQTYPSNRATSEIDIPVQPLCTYATSEVFAHTLDHVIRTASRHLSATDRILYQQAIQTILQSIWKKSKVASVLYEELSTLQFRLFVLLGEIAEE